MLSACDSEVDMDAEFDGDWVPVGVALPVCVEVRERVGLPESVTVTLGVEVPVMEGIWVRVIVGDRVSVTGCEPVEDCDELPVRLAVCVLVRVSVTD